MLSCYWRDAWRIFSMICLISTITQNHNKLYTYLIYIYAFKIIVLSTYNDIISLPTHIFNNLPSDEIKAEIIIISPTDQIQRTFINFLFTFPFKDLCCLIYASLTRKWTRKTPLSNLNFFTTYYFNTFRRKKAIYRIGRFTDRRDQIAWNCSGYV